MRIIDWSSAVCSSDLLRPGQGRQEVVRVVQPVGLASGAGASACNPSARSLLSRLLVGPHLVGDPRVQDLVAVVADAGVDRSLGKDLGATPHHVLVLDAGLVGEAEAVPADAVEMVAGVEIGRASCRERGCRYV